MKCCENAQMASYHFLKECITIGSYEPDDITTKEMDSSGYLRTKDSILDALTISVEGEEMYS